MFPIKLTLTIIGIILLYLWLSRKSQGKKGTWDSKADIEEFALLSQSIKKKKPKDCDGSIGEQICRKHLEMRLREKFTRERPEFLKNPITSNKLELDCFNKKLNLALEYNGKQHYEYVPKFHKTRSDFHNQKYRDNIKRDLCLKNGINLIEVPYTVKHNNIPAYIDMALEKLGILKFN